MRADDIPLDHRGPAICPPKPLNQLNRLNLTQHFQNPQKKQGLMSYSGGPGPGTTFLLSLPHSPSRASAVRAADGGRFVRHLPLILLGFSAFPRSYPQTHPRPRAASTAPRRRRMQTFAAIFAD